MEQIINKKVLLRERKRHTAHCVANTPYVVLTGYPSPGGVRVPPPGGVGLGTPPGGYPVRYPPGGSGYDPRGVRVPPGGVPGQVPPRGGTRSGTPPGGYPVRYPPWGGLGTPPGGSGYPPGGVRVPPQGGPGTPPGEGGRGYPDPPSPPVDRQTPVKTVPSRRTTYAGGKYPVSTKLKTPDDEFVYT